MRVLTKSEKNPHAGKEIIELALPIDTGLTDYLAKSIYEFNATDDEYIIRIWDKYKTGFAQGRGLVNLDTEDEKMYQMIQDLKGDDAPDLAIGIQNNYAMRDDVFLDLSDFLKPEVLEKPEEVTANCIFCLYQLLSKVWLQIRNCWKTELSE